MEKDFLWGNCWALAASVVFLVTSIVVLKNLPLAVLSMPAALAVRLCILEARLSERLGLKTQMARLAEAVVCAGFVGIAFGVGGWQGMAGYVVFATAALGVSWRLYLRPVVQNGRNLLKRD